MAMPEGWLCLESCHVLRSLVVKFPRGIHFCVTKPGAVWDHLDVGVESTMCKGNEMAVYSHQGVGWGVCPHSAPECFVQSHRSDLIGQ